MKQVLEREAKWDVDEDFVLPELGSLAPGLPVTQDTVDLISEYYDTADRALQTHGVLMRRRSGDDDTGWQLKIPADDGREELHWPLTDSPPDELVRLLAGIRLGKPLEKVATVHTVRRRYRFSRGDEPHSELADDRVRAWSDEKLLAWRELEVELGPNTRAVSKRVSRGLRKAGARPSRHASKLAHLLPPTPHAERRSAAAEALAAYLEEQIDAIVAGDLGLRRGIDPIHDTRVATRRLRSTLRVFGPLLDRSAVGGLDEELKWFAGLLGDVRDGQVQQRRFGEALDQLPDELVLGPVRARVQNDLQGVEFPARSAVREAMDSDRYVALLATLRRLRETPPVSEDLGTAALAKRARKAQRKADRRLAEGLASRDDAPLHRGRKAAKRARYAAELLGSRRTTKHYKRFQTVLGDLQDTVVAREALRRMGAAGAVSGENGFTFGLLYAREQRIAEECRRTARKMSG